MESQSTTRADSVPSIRPAIRIGSPADILAAVPYLMGFHPADSIVLIGLREPEKRIGLAMRYDLTDETASRAADVVGDAANVLREQNLVGLIAIGYGPARLVTPMADAVRSVADSSGMAIWDLLRVEDGRYYSYVCQNPSCCPPEGVAFDITTSAVAAGVTALGAVAQPSREAIAAMVAPLTGEAVEGARRRAITMAYELTRAAEQAGEHPVARMNAEGLRAVSDIIGTYRAGGNASDGELAWLGLTLASLRVRDDAWARMDPQYRDAHLRMWTDVVRVSDDEWVAPAASLLAFVAWQDGNGCLANVALERALEADPGYSMAALLCEVISNGAPPSAAVSPMTPEEVADSYAKQGH